MPKHKVSDDVLCPFYRCEMHQEIHCEGVAQQTATHVAFAQMEDMRQYMQQHCKTGWCACRIAQMLNAKYE